MVNYIQATDDLGNQYRFERDDFPAGGGLPSWFQSGDGSPVGVITPSQEGALYQDTTNGALYEAVGVTSGHWIQLSAAFGDRRMNLGGGPIDLPQSSETVLTWSLFDLAGTDLELDPDNQTVLFKTNGTYEILLSFGTLGGHDTATIGVDQNVSPGQATVKGGTQGFYLPSYTFGAAGCVNWRWTFAGIDANPATSQFLLTALGGATDEVLNTARLDIVRIS